MSTTDKRNNKPAFKRGKADPYGAAGKKWCSIHNSTTHNDADCYQQGAFRPQEGDAAVRVRLLLLRVRMVLLLLLAAGSPVPPSSPLVQFPALAPTVTTEHSTVAAGDLTVRIRRSLLISFLFRSVSRNDPSITRSRSG